MLCYIKNIWLALTCLAFTYSVWGPDQRCVCVCVCLAHLISSQLFCIEEQEKGRLRLRPQTVTEENHYCKVTFMCSSPLLTLFLTLISPCPHPSLPSWPYEYPKGLLFTSTTSACIPLAHSNHRHTPFLYLMCVCVWVRTSALELHVYACAYGMHCAHWVCLCVCVCFKHCSPPALSHPNCLEHSEDMTSQRGKVGRWRVFCGEGRAGLWRLLFVLRVPQLEGSHLIKTKI